MTPATVTIAPQILGNVPSDYLGLSYGKAWMYTPTRFFSASNARAVGSFRTLGKAIVRIGTMESEVWTPNGKGQTKDQIAPSDVQALAGFLKATGWRCTYGINFKTNTPANAAAEAVYVSQQLGDDLVGFEIGNELDGYASVNNAAASPNRIASAWNVYAAAIRKALPTAKFVGPSIAIASNVAKWDKPFMAVNAPLVTINTTHFYVDGPKTATMQEILQPLVHSGYYMKMVTEMRDLRTTYPAPWTINETNNIYSGGVHGISDAWGAALYATDFSFLTAQEGAHAINFISGGVGAGAYYSPITDKAGITYGPAPEYYGVYMVHLATQGQTMSLLSTTLNAGGANASAYALWNSSGQSALVLVNKSASNLSVTVNLPPGTAVAKPQIYVASAVGGPGEMNIKNMTIQGAFFDQEKKDGTLRLGQPYTAPAANVVYAPAYSIVVVRATALQNTKQGAK